MLYKKKKKKKEKDYSYIPEIDVAFVKWFLARYGKLYEVKSNTVRRFNRSICYHDPVIDTIFTKTRRFDRDRKYG